MPNNEKSEYAQAEAVVEQLIRAYELGESIGSIAAAHGLRREAVTTVLVGAGAVPSTPNPDRALEYVREDLTTYEIRNAQRILRFSGVELGSSTSYRVGAKRWIEFTLHRTEGGSYVLSRVGETRVCHTPGCGTAARAGLATISREELPADRQPCDDCRPDLTAASLVAVEHPRHWAKVIETPEGVVAALHKSDGSGTRYLTAVAARLLEEVAASDPAIEAAYRVIEVA